MMFFFRCWDTSAVDTDPSGSACFWSVGSGSGSVPRGAKWPATKKKKLETWIVLKCWIFSSLILSFMDAWDENIAILEQQSINFLTENLPFLVIKSLDPDHHWNQCVSTTMCLQGVLSIKGFCFGKASKLQSKARVGKYGVFCFCFFNLPLSLKFA